MNGYIRMIDVLYKYADNNPTIGIILCLEENEATAKYSVLNDAQLVFVSRYLLQLPTPEELQHEIEQEHRRLENQENYLCEVCD